MGATGSEDISPTYASFTRWLSHDKACNNMSRCIVGIIEQMQTSVRSLTGDAKAEIKGLINQVASFRFLATVYFFCDALQPANILSKKSQTKAVTFTEISAAYSRTKLDLTTMLTSMDEKTCPVLMAFITDLRYGAYLLSPISCIYNVM
jgi:hypothetical protein